MSQECFYEDAEHEWEDELDFDITPEKDLQDRYAARRHIERYWEMKNLRRYLEDFDAF